MFISLDFSIPCPAPLDFRFRGNDSVGEAGRDWIVILPSPIKGEGIFQHGNDYLWSRAELVQFARVGKKKQGQRGRGETAEIARATIALVEAGGAEALVG